MSVNHKDEYHQIKLKDITMKKINLKQFQSEQLSVEERLNTRAGSGRTTSHRLYTRSMGKDQDQQQQDRD
jgi:hypothetical protein